MLNTSQERVTVYEHTSKWINLQGEQYRSAYKGALHHFVQEGQSDLTLFTATPPAKNCVKYDCMRTNTLILLSIEVKIHLMPRHLANMYCCQYCLKSYTRQHDLKRHLGEKYFVQQEPSNTPKKRSVALQNILAMLLQKSARQDEMVDFTQNIEETHGTPAAAAIRGTPQPLAAAMRGPPSPAAIKGTPPPTPPLVATRGTPPPPPPPPPPPQGKPAVVQTSHMTSPSESGVKYVHPFAMIVAGCTGSGKTYFVKDMLQSMRITPKPQRIIWLYKRWQPLYATILNTVQPEVQFIQGIPPDLDQDSVVDPSVRNLLILDDLMSSATKDPRITDLFTEGSHHRNRSVIILSHNLYFSKDPTQRRNAHYLVLFKSPVDKQQIKTLARQMYPDMQIW